MPSSFLTFGASRPTRSADGWRIAANAVGRDPSDRDLDCPTHRALERWAARMLGSADHERRVADLATDLFDVTRTLHGLATADLRLLRWAAAVHDVGRSVCDETHPADGARLLRADRSLPLSPTERRHLAYLTLHHRGKVPAPGRDGVLARSDDAGRLLRVLALLRAADGLDNRALGRGAGRPPRVLFGLIDRKAGPAELHVTCYLSVDSTKARKVYGRRKKFRLLESLLGCRTRPQVLSLDPLRAVA
ncbi:MAG TPA: HD domain-containing protein [Humisphaera sp.]